MQYTKFGKTGVDLSKLGFGAMRLPSRMVDGKTVYDEDEGMRILRRAYELGVNYFDTAPYYCDKVSEVIVGKALKPFRDKVYISTKNPIENASGDDFEKRLEASLGNLSTDYIDFYHMWGISLEGFVNEIDVKDGPLDRAKRLKEQGVIRHISFSFHDKSENMIEIIKRSDGVFESVLCQYNLLDRSNEEAIAFADEQGLGVVIMGPVGGGRLGAPSKTIQSLLPGKVYSSPELALRFVLSNPHVSVALSGMSSMAMVEENCLITERAVPLTAEDDILIKAAMEENKRLEELYCTGCNYCMPCPQEVNIPEIFKMMNYHRVYNLTDYAKAEYAEIGKNEWKNYKSAEACADCGLCEQKCPQKLKIREQLKQTHETLS